MGRSRSGKTFRTGQGTMPSLLPVFVLNSQLGLKRALSFKVIKREKKVKEMRERENGRLKKIIITQNLGNGKRLFLVKLVRSLPSCLYTSNMFTVF